MRLNKQLLESTGVKAPVLSEGMAYHLQNDLDLTENIFRPMSTKYFELIMEARDLFKQDLLEVTDDERTILAETDLGEMADYNGITVPLDFPMSYEQLVEAKYHDKDVQLNKPKRGGSKKFYVFVRTPKGTIKKVSFGDTSGLKAKINDPKARKSFAARHKCAQAKDKTTANYWSCRLPKYSKLLGLKSNFSGYW